MEEIAKKAELSPGAIYLYFSLNLATLQYLYNEIKRILIIRRYLSKRKYTNSKRGCTRHISTIRCS